MKKCVAVLGTLDTKGKEISYIVDKLRQLGMESDIIDVGILGEPAIEPTIDRKTIASLADTSIEEILAKSDKVNAMARMAAGAAIHVCRKIHSKNYNGEIGGIIAIGGAQGTSIGSQVMQTLPFGFPKIIISAVANGNTPFGAVVGTKDIMILNSVVDLQGLNSMTAKVFDNAVKALCGMVEGEQETYGNTGSTIAVTSAGVTTACTLKVQELLENAGCEVITFHCSGSAAVAMEEMAKAQLLDGILDISPHNITDQIAGGEMAASADRLLWIETSNIPYILVPGCADLILGGAIESLSQKWRERKHYRHNSYHTHVKADYSEMFCVGAFASERLSKSLGDVQIIIPARGFSQQNIEGGKLFDPHSDAGFERGCKSIEAMQPCIETVDMHINDESFAVLLAERMKKLLGKRNRQ